MVFNVFIALLVEKFIVIKNYYSKNSIIKIFKQELILTILIYLKNYTYRPLLRTFSWIKRMGINKK